MISQVLNGLFVRILKNHTKNKTKWKSHALERKLRIINHVKVRLSYDLILINEENVQKGLNYPQGKKHKVGLVQHRVISKLSSLVILTLHMSVMFLGSSAHNIRSVICLGYRRLHVSESMVKNSALCSCLGFVSSARCKKDWVSNQQL